MGKSGTEKLAEILNLFFGSILEIIKEYGGIVLKFGIDAILVGFYGDREESKNIAGNCALRSLERATLFLSVIQ